MTGSLSRRRRRTRQRAPVIDLETSSSSCIDLTEEEDHFVDLTSNNSQTSVDSDSILIVGSATDSPPEHRRRLLPPSPEIFDDDLELPPCPFPVDLARPEQSGSSGSLIQSPDPVKITCPVCLDDDKTIKRSKRKIASTTCGHVFCDECISNAVKSQSCCPVCRKKLTARQYHTLHI